MKVFLIIYVMAEIRFRFPLHKPYWDSFPFPLKSISSVCTAFNVLQNIYVVGYL